VVDGITQIQVNAKQGLTFAVGAKGLLRLDPDIILMGEMRDAASARVALDVADNRTSVPEQRPRARCRRTITALRNFGLEDFEIAASLDLIVAQRLVRRLCPKCRREEVPTRRKSNGWKFSASRFPRRRGMPRVVPTAA